MAGIVETGRHNSPTAMPTVAAGLTPNPWKKRAVMYVPYFSATAAPQVETREMAVPTMKTMRRPYISLNEDQNRGPTERPSAGMATVQLTCDEVAENCSCISGKEGTVVVVM